MVMDRFRIPKDQNSNVLFHYERLRLIRALSAVISVRSFMKKRVLVNESKCGTCSKLVLNPVPQVETLSLFTVRFQFKVLTTLSLQFKSSGAKI